MVYFVTVHFVYILKVCDITTGNVVSIRYSLQARDLRLFKLVVLVSATEG